jgi:methionyl-tRNA formyltransferase
MNEVAYIVAGSKKWNREVYDDVICRLPGHWEYVATKEELTEDYLRSVAPRYLFFLHWSWIVPDTIVDNYECVCFHMTDVPYGRGGSPLQNLILRGHTTTKLSALRMTTELDAGPVYLKKSLNLEGSAQEIYVSATRLAASMIRQMITEQLSPVSQAGEPVFFKRRIPEESAIPQIDSLDALYNFIRMLDADGYPRAFLMIGGLRYEFSKATWVDGTLTAQVSITAGEVDP